MDLPDASEVHSSVTEFTTEDEIFGGDALEWRDSESQPFDGKIDQDRSRTGSIDTCCTQHRVLMPSKTEIGERRVQGLDSTEEFVVKNTTVSRCIMRA